jgi:hypothetical protein
LRADTCSAALAAVIARPVAKIQIALVALLAV